MDQTKYNSCFGSILRIKANVLQSTYLSAPTSKHQRLFMSNHELELNLSKVTIIVTIELNNGN
ncbi:hypothetical protein DERP_014656 [Dermatophagoides pteronyssinus]|uniref:Uncharacterized protein n=1 Tax=Dermatophagoides pteronyssinus TaxID=6956 RepID=A0ABQ8JRL3_DERPT|nr:hypothetical protein DERP_014656 [Dermatophagoides pteronyssinus]